MTALQRGAIAHATTDATGYFALPLAALGGAGLPQAWTLGQNYPNPFNPATIIPYQVPTASWVRLDVFNVLGQRIATLVDEEHSAGVHTAVWDATDAAGRPVGAGVYFYRLHSAGQPTLTRRMVLIDGQAGQAPARVAPLSAVPTAPASEGVYGLSVTGAGLVTYVDASFGVRSDMASVEVVVDAVAERPRGKALTDGVLGDVNGDGQVALDDALLVMTYVVHGSVELPPAGDLSLGDVNGDGQVALDDALLLVAYAINPADGSLPSGLGEAVSGSGGAWVTGPIRRLTNHEAGGESPVWSPDGKHIAFTSRRDGNYDIYVMEADGSNPRRLTNHEADDWSPVWSPDGQHIAFTSNRDDNSDIYVMGADGSNLRRLTDHEAADGSPVWSPDGKHIAFTSNRDDNSDIYVMGADGSKPRRLTYHEAADGWPVWSPDGKHIAFHSYRDDNLDIYVMGADGSKPRRLTYHEAADGWPVWSPDGKHIAFHSYRDDNSDIYVMGADGSNLRRLTDHEADDGSPVWSPDGKHIAFVSDRNGNYNSELYVMGANGSNPRRLTYHEAADGSPVWSPDGKHIAFTSNRDDNEDIYVMELKPESDAGDNPATAIPLAVGEPFAGYLSAGDIDYFRVTVSSPVTLVATTIGSTDTYGIIENSSGSVLNENDDSGEGSNFFMGVAVGTGTYYIKVSGYDTSSSGTYTLTIQMDDSPAVRLTYNSDEDGWPVWSPDGKHIAFTSSRASRDGNYNTEIYVMEADGSNPRRLTYHEDRDEEPVWSPDGKHIAFMSDRHYYWEIYVMEADGSNPRRLTYNSDENRSPSWSPDGKHIAFTSNRDDNEDIYVMEADGSTPRRLTYHEAHDRSPSWSPDGQHIAFTSSRASRDGNYNTDIYVMEADGSTPRRLTYHEDRDEEPVWSPDGQHIAFHSYRDDNYEIYVMEADGTNLCNLTNHQADDRSPSWSPDGQHIAFTSSRIAFYSDHNDHKDQEIYVMKKEAAQCIPNDGDSPATPIPPSVVGLYGTLLSSFTNVFFAVVVGGTEVEGEGGGSVAIAGNEWTLQDYSPDGELIMNGTLNVRVAETPIPLSGTIVLSGSHDAELLVLDMAISVAGTDLSATGTITIDGTEFDVAALSAAAETAAAGE